MTPTENLKLRYRQYFRWLDVGQNSVLTKEDYALIIENAKKIFQSKDEDAENLHHNTEWWWKIFDNFAVDGRMTEEDFAQALGSTFVTLAEEISKTFNNVFDLCDRNQDNQLSLREFLISHKILNVKNLDEVENIFRRIDVENKGYITREEYVLANVNYFTRDDPKNDYGFLYRNLRK